MLIVSRTVRLPFTPLIVRGITKWTFLPTCLLFCSNSRQGDCQAYRKYLSQHIIKVLEGKEALLQECKPYLQSIIGAPHADEQQIRAKCNMIFNVHCLQQPLNRFHGKLSQLVESGKIQNQSHLDRIIAKLRKQIKKNDNLQLHGLLKAVEGISPSAMQSQIVDLVNQDKTVSEICKYLRPRYEGFQSKEIYAKVKQICEQHQRMHQNKQKSIENRDKMIWDKLENIRSRLLADECNGPQIYQKHLVITRNQLRFRFPPEPNGHLHIGHVKAIRINFETAKKSGGVCYLRYDDTNPETESHEYISNILSSVRWLGYEPDKITYASDYFHEMQDYAVKLIQGGHAYVCDASKQQIESERRAKKANHDRNRPVQESLQMFPGLQPGQTLRLKLDEAAANPTLRDPVIYRVKKHPHPRTGSKFRIYPTYDFAHCICDSLEHIDYSLCSLEFQVRRELYYKILHLLNLYKPTVWEYSRLNIEDSVVSKRKIKKFIEDQVVADWHDPRLLTLGAMINRGYTPTALISFIDKINSSRAGNQNTVQLSLLERELKKELYEKAEKSMMVLEPVEVDIQGLASDQQAREIPIYTTSKLQQQYRKVTLTKKIFIEQSEQPQQYQYFVLKYFGVFQLTSTAPLKLRKSKKQLEQLKREKKGFKVVHWISDADAVECQTTCFHRLLHKSEPNLDSKRVYCGALRAKDIVFTQENQGVNKKYWQMERLGYFTFMSNGDFIRCVTL